jgi:hypothetical protein
VQEPGELPEPGGFPPGLSWSWQMDFAALLAALGDGAVTGPGGGDTSAPGPLDASTPDTSTLGADTPDTSTVKADGPGTGAQEAGDEPPSDGGPAGEEAVLAALDQGAEPLPAGVVAVRVAERLAPGPDLVAWLATAPAQDVTDYDLPGAANSWRRVVGYGQAQELADIAQIASRAAQRDPKIGTGPDGRPNQIPASAVAEVSLALTMTRYSAAAWTDLAVDLTWKLSATGTALAQGLIDLPRARLIAQATSLLTDTAARAVEERVLPTAGKHTTAMLRNALHRAVIAADPDGAERRQKDAERRAKVSLYPEPEGTATLTAQGLPAISAAAAMARLTAMARAMKAAGAGGGINFLRAQVLAGLLLGTLPLIPPAQGAPPDGPGPSDNDGPGAEPNDSSDGPSDGPVTSGGPDSPGGGPEAEGSGGPDAGVDEEPAREGGRPRGGFDGGPWDGFPDPRDEDAPEGTGDDLLASRPILTGKYRLDSSYRPGNGPPGNGPPDDDRGSPDEDWLETGPLPGWPGLPGSIPPGLAASGASMSRPVPGLLDVTVAWHTLTGRSSEPGNLGRIGPITASLARYLADCAARDPATIWRIIVTDDAGQALTVTRLPRRASRVDEPPSASPGPGIGLVGRITLTISEHILDSEPPPTSGPDPLPGTGPPRILHQALRHAAKALASARAATEADTDAGGCAHLMASPAYRVPTRLRDYITARDVTCRFTTCRQPVWCCDIDHTTPYDQGGRTCKCNTGGLCRAHHQLKQLPGWTLRQISPGTFQWTTPSGRAYTTTPDTHPL